MKKIISLILSVLVAFSAMVVLVGCNTTTVTSTEYVINSFENYTDIAKISANAWIGYFRENDDEQFITDGKGSAKFVHVNKGETAGSHAVDMGTLMTEVFYISGKKVEEKYRKLDRMDYIAIDVYNDSDKDYMMGAHIDSDAGWDAPYINGGVLKARQWNRLVFDINPYFFKRVGADGKTTSVVADSFYFYINGIWNGADEIPFYVDNFRIALYDQDITAPTPAFNKDSNGNTTLVAFDSMTDAKLFNMSHTGFYDGKPTVAFELAKDAEEIFPDGAYKMTMYDTCLDQHSHWVSNSYDLTFTTEINKAVKGAQEIKLDVYNPDIFAKNVCISVYEGKEKTDKYFEIEPGKTMTLIYDDEEALKNADSFVVRILTWNLGDNLSTVYVSNLRTKKA